MHVILGANGAISTSLAHALRAQQLPLRLVSRTPKALEPSDSVFAADLLDARQTAAAVAGASTAYLMAGLLYDARVWARDWPNVMTNVINACRTHGTKLVFFDNVYALGLPADGRFSEESPIAPRSKKGEARAQIVRQLTEAWTRGELRAVITRAADFYGPRVGNSFLNTMVIDPLARGKQASVLMGADIPHSYFYTPDAGPALVTLATSAQADNQVWNLPHAPALTGREIVAACAQHLGTAPKMTVLKRWMMQPIGWFNPVIREFDEMLYQFAAPYVVDSSKIERAFGLKATTMPLGLTASLDAARA